MTSTSRRFSFILAVSALSATTLVGQQDRIRDRLDNRRTVRLNGNIHALARPQDDAGNVEPSFPLTSMTLFLRPSPAQQKALDELLDRQQDPSSPDYHRWLTPERFADEFGPSASETGKIAGWLQSRGFKLASVARGRMSLAFSGSADQVKTAFQTETHRYRVNGEMHYANVREPSIPEALQDIVSGIGGLNDFLPMPEITSTAGVHNIAPDDLATIYNITPLYNAGIDGSGQKLAIIGSTAIDLADIAAFRSRFNLSANVPQVMLAPNFPDPGRISAALGEADIDIEWSGAVARNATIIYVYSGNPFNALIYAIDQDLAPVISSSYSLGCEQANRANVAFFRSLAQQGNAQGITWVNSSGDGGAAACDPNGSLVAQNGLSVRLPASIPEVTAVGGTQFDDAAGSYWNSANNASGGSAISYIPETSWNEVAVRNALWASGGGMSSFFPKPSWQAGPGVPDGDFRNVPDVALSAAIQHDGYAVVTNGLNQIFGGTSVATPPFAGMIALLNQYLMSTGAQTQAGLGNINPNLYRLGQGAPGVFHDIASGGNIVRCASGSPDCANGSFGYSAGAGYDRVTGLGSVDANNLIHQWTSQPAVNSAVVPYVSPSPVYQQPADANGPSWPYTITLTEENGIGTTLTGFTVNGVDNSGQIVADFGSATIPPHGKLTSNLSGRNLTVPLTRVFVFSGMDANGRQWSQQVSIQFLGPAAAPQISGTANAASFREAYAPGMIMSVFGSQLGNSTQAAAVLPLLTYMGQVSATVNGVSAPLYFVSPGQVNLQIPYGTAAGEATLSLNNGQTSSTFKFTVSDAAPGIFAAADGSLVPFSTGRRGQTLTLFTTGEGRVTPALATGSTPAATTPLAQLPKPQLPVKLTVGGVDALIAFTGIPSGLAGAMQINFQVPQAAPTGVQPVVVTVGDAASPPVNLTVSE